MKQSRRSFIQGVIATGASIGLAGCQSDDPDPPETDGPEVGELSIPNPIVTSVDSPIPEIHETNVEEREEQDDLYTGAFVNNGATGRVVVELYWADGKISEDNVDRSKLEYVDGTVVEVERDTSGEFSFDATRPDEYSGFYFFASPVSVTAGLRNDGGDGDVIVTLFKGDDEVDSQTIQMKADEETTVNLANEGVLGDTAFDVQAQPVDN